MENIIKRIGETREKILKTVWLSGKSITNKEISEKMGLKQRAVNMHLLGLRNAGLVKISEYGYIITEEGKRIIGFPKIDAEKAKKILRKTSPENAFRFYVEMDNPLGVTSESLNDLYEKIRLIDIRSLKFHTVRGDFQSWVRYLGDAELEKRLELIQESRLTGEMLREELYKTLKARCDELASLISR